MGNNRGRARTPWLACALIWGYAVAVTGFTEVALLHVGPGMYAMFCECVVYVFFVQGSRVLSPF